MPFRPARSETLRLEALRATTLLDSAPEAFSESVAALAASLANTPISAVSLVDVDRQWFKSSCGLDERETGRDVSFCAWAIQQVPPLIVPDARRDPRFRDNALVTGKPHIRFYAGFPLVFRGQAIGALCVIDDRPRELSATQIEALTRLAEATSAWIANYPTSRA